MAFGLGGLSEEILGAITGGAERALPYIVHSVTAGLSGSEILDSLQEAGLGIRTENLFSLVKGLRSALDAATYQRGLSADEFPDPSKYTGSATFMQRRYAYIVEVTGNNPFSGSVVSQHVTVSSDDPLRNSDLEQYVGDIMEAGFESYQLNVDGFEVTSVLVDPRFLP